MSDQEYFQSGQKQCVLEIVNTNPISNFNLSLRKGARQNNHQWKFQKIKRILPSNSPRKIQTKNISFQAEEFDDISDEDNDNDDDDRYSAFTSKYAKCQQLYMKKHAIGTRWLGKKQYFASIFVDPKILGKIDLLSLYKPPAPNQFSQKKISFHSAFQSGNLMAAYQIRQYQYDLILQNDTNSKGNTQWFYFEMKNIPARTKIKINIVNMLKSDSLFNYGMQPCVFSEKAYLANSQGWFRTGSHIRYFRNDNKVDGSRRYHYTLTFTISTPYEADSMKICHCYPYTVQNLQEYLEKLEKKPGIKSILKRQSAGLTLGRNQIQVLKISEDNPRKKDQRKIIFVSARQHPGETPGSFVCQGFINFITSDEKQAVYLRKNYQIIVFPMINPDGVMVGNYRSNLYGLDLNRRWDGSKAKENLQPIKIKKYISECLKHREGAFFMDLHGHSRKLFSFFYGNSNLQDPISVRLFPFICAKNSDNRMRFEDSTFVCEEGKRRTARIQLGYKLKIPNVFTFQTSFFGYINKKRQKVHFTIEHFRQLGYILGKCIYTYERGKNNPESNEGQILRKFSDELKNKPQLIAKGEKQGSGSESEPEKNQIADNQYNKLLGSLEFSKELGQREKSRNKKINSKKDVLVKQIPKVSRQLHVMDIARVNSIFPNDILALMPSSYGKDKQKSPRKKKAQKIMCSVYVQTEEVPFIKIYDICKVQQRMDEQKFQRTQFKSMSESSTPSKSSAFRTVVRPKSSSTTYIEMQSPAKTSLKKKRHESGIISKSSSSINIDVQTIITFPPNADFLGKSLECVIINPISKVELLKRRSNFSTINPLSSSQVQPNKRSTQSFKIGLRALNVETLRMKKRNIQ